MKQFAFPLSDQPALTLRGHGDLRLAGWDRQDASVSSAPGYSLKVDQDETGLRITCLDDCEILIPSGAAVTIEKADGDLHISNITGKISAEKIGGSAVFFHIGTAVIGKIGGDCDASEVAGDFSVEKIGGSLHGTGFAGDLTVEKVGGDIVAGGVARGFTARAGGSVHAQLLEGFGPQVQVRAGGDLKLHFPENDEGKYVLSSGDSEINLRMASRSEQVQSRHYEFTAGQGSRVQVEARAGGMLELTAQPFTEAESFAGSRFFRRESFFGPWEEISRTKSEVIDRAARTAEEAARRAEQTMEAALRRMEQRSPQREGTEPPAGAPSMAAAPDDERMMILKMLKEKKLTVEEAEALIEALEGSEQSD